MWVETIRSLMRPFMGVSFVGMTLYLAFTDKLDP